MWFAILGGVAAGLLVAMALVFRSERGYRTLFSDTHLFALAECLEAARAATVNGAQGPATSTTFEGVEARWEVMPRHVAVTLSAQRMIAPAAARFLLAFAIEQAHGRRPVAALQLDRKRFALVWDKDVLDVRRPLAALDDRTLAATRAKAADAMGGLSLSHGHLSAYR
jgi:hypothetical protein